MMKSNICLLLTSILLYLGSMTESIACGPSGYHPYGYKMYRVYDADADQQTDQTTENCLLWQKLTSSEIPLSDIRQVVYKYTPDQMKTLMTVSSDNAFASWIKDNNDTEIYDFLVLAKICEKTRGILLDPWYYPSQNDGTYLTLNEIENKARSYDGHRLRDRYALQAIRAMFSSKKYQEIVDYWRQVEPSLPEGVIKEMICDYVLGAYARVNNIDEALEYFINKEDLNSILYCLNAKGEITGLDSRLECINKYAPDSPQIPEILQEAISGIEPWGEKDLSYRYRMTNSLVNANKRSYTSSNRPLYNQLYTIAIKMTKDPSSDKALWYYTAAYLTDLDGKPEEAWEHIRNASKYPASQYLKESIRVMNMYLDAKVSNYDAAYEARLYKDLKWLDDKIRNNITENIRTDVNDWGGFKLQVNFSFYYWNDMLRRILLAEVCPRMIDRGMTVRALQLANMADNRLLMLCEGKNRYRFSDHFFTMMEASNPRELKAYVRQTRSPSSSFDAFLNERGYVDHDYLYDVLGTNYICRRDYRNAVECLSEVSEGYQSKLNTADYMNRDPFSMAKKRKAVHPGYKLDFATKMLHLEAAIASDCDNSFKGMAMLRYATGIRNSYTYCWPLTRYYDSYDLYDEGQIASQVLKDVTDMMDEALSMIDNPELAALALVNLCQWKTAVQKYPDAYASRFAGICCDNLCDYSMERVISGRYR